MSRHGAAIVFAIAVLGFLGCIARSPVMDPAAARLAPDLAAAGAVAGCEAPDVQAIVVSGGTLRWRGLERGMSVESLEALLGARVVTDSGRAPGGEVWATVQLEGREVRVALDDDPPTVVLGFYVPFRGAAGACTCEQLVSLLASVAPDLVPWSLRGNVRNCAEGSASFGLPGDRTTVLFWKQSAGMWWAPAGWVE